MNSGDMTWDLDVLYRNIEDWEKDFDMIPVLAEKFASFRGRLHESPEILRQAIEAGRKAYLSGLGRVLSRGASASDPLTGFLRD